LDIIIKKFVYR